MASDQHAPLIWGTLVIGGVSFYHEGKQHVLHSKNVQRNVNIQITPFEPVSEVPPLVSWFCFVSEPGRYFGVGERRQRSFTVLVYYACMD